MNSYEKLKSENEKLKKEKNKIIKSIINYFFYMSTFRTSSEASEAKNKLLNEINIFIENGL